MPERDKQCDQISEGFQILAAYGRHGICVGADTILAGPCPTETKPEDVEKLKSCGWQACDHSDCWEYGVY